MNHQFTQNLEIVRSEMEHSQACCHSVTELEKRLSDFDFRLASTSDKCDTIKGRLDKELAGTGGGKGWVAEERFNSRLREVEKRLNNTLRKTEQRCTNTANSVKDTIQRDFTQLHNMVVSQLDDHNFKIGKIELEVSVLGDTVTDHSRRLGHLENITSFLDRSLTSTTNMCNVTCGCNGNSQTTDDSVKTLQWRVVSNQDEIKRFNSTLNRLSETGDSLINKVIDLNNSVKKITAVTGENGEHFTRIITEIETLGRDFEDCSVCHRVEQDFRLFSNFTKNSLNKCQTGLTDLQQKIGSGESACSQICSNLQEEVGQLRDEVEQCTGQCKIDINDLKKHLDGHTFHSGKLGGDLKSMQGELSEVLVNFNSVNNTLKNLGRILQTHGKTLTDLTNSKDNTIFVVS